MGVEYRLRIRSADNTTDAIVVTSTRGGTNPWIMEPPKGDGASHDPLDGRTISAQYTFRIADGITSGTDRVFTSQLDDASGRPQLTRRRAYGEFRVDGGAWQCLIPGYLDTYQLSTDISWDVTIVDANALEHKLLAFGPHTVNGQLESFQSYVTRWPNRGCIFGGPVRTAAAPSGSTTAQINAAKKFGNILDLQGWQFSTSSLSKSELIFVSGYESPAYQVTRRLSDVADRANAAAAPYFDATGSNVQQFPEFAPNAGSVMGYTGVIVQVGTGSGFTDADDEYYCAGANFSFDPTTRNLTAFFLSTTKLGGRNQLRLTGFLPSRFLDQTVRARCFTALPSDASPIYWDGHPVDLIVTLGEEAGFSYDATSVAAVRAALGDDLRIAIRINAVQNQGDFLEALVYGPFGIGVRPKANGDLELFTARIIDSAPPSTTITNEDVVRGSVKAYELDPTTAVKTVTVTAQSWTSGSVDAGTDLSKYPTDGVLVQPVTQQYVNADLGAPETDTEQVYTIPGMPHRAGSWALNWGKSLKFADWAKAIAYEVFDRWGRGTLTAEFTGVYGGAADGLRLGDQTIVALKQLPNHNKRLVDDASVPGRAMQVLFCDPTPNATELHVVDCGPNAQPVGTLPVLAIAAASRTVATVTITNAAALNAAHIAVRLQMAVTFDGASAVSTAYAMVGYFEADAVPTAPITLPAVTAGATVFARGRSENTTLRPSNYSSPVHVTLASIDTITGLTATPDVADGSAVRLDWTVGANATGDPIDVLLRAANDTAAGDVRIITLPAGSITYTLEHLAPGTAYTASIDSRDQLTGDTSNPATVTFTTSGNAVTLDAPTDPHGFSGTQDPALGFPQQDGIYGLAVAATVFPGFVEFVEELETAPESGIYGDPTLIATVPSVQGNWTLFEAIAPNDRLRRQLSARSIRDGADPSAYTTTVVVAPWTSQALGLFLLTVGDASILRVSQTESADRTTRDFSLVVGADVTAVHVHFRTVPIDFTEDATDFSEDEDTTDNSQLFILVPDNFPGRVVTFSIPHPPRNYKVAGRMVPFDGNAEGENRVFEVDAAPQALNAILRASRATPTTADLTIDITFGPSDSPVTCAIVQDTAIAETTLVSKTLTTPTTLSPTTDAALGGIALPQGKDSLSFFAILTDVSGQPFRFGPARIDRDPLPNGTISVSNYRAAPLFVLAFDSDVDAIIYTAHDGKTKTWNRAALTAAGSPVQYVVGQTARDDGSQEDPLPVGGDRTGATIAYTGGGSTVLLWSGTLHGQPQNPPTADIRSTLNADRNSKTVTIRPDTQVDEQLEVYYREGNTDTALQWVLCVDVSDPTIRAVDAGDVIGALDYFRRVDGVGVPVQKLAAIPLVRDQITVHGVMIEGAESGMQSPWLDVVLSLMEQPWIESVEAAFDPTTRALSAIIVAGAHVASVGVLFSDNAAFASLLSASGNVTDGNHLTLSVTLSAAQLGKPWYVKVTPYNAAALAGLPGAPQQASVAVPAIVGEPDTQIVESGGTATITTTIDDPGQFLNLSWTNGTITGALSYEILKVGVNSVEAAGSHSLSGTVHTWTKVVALDPLHAIPIKIVAHFVDGSRSEIFTNALDSNKISDAASGPTVADNGVTATVTETLDNDTAVGAGCAQYRINGGAWNALTVSAARLVQFNVARLSSAKQTVEIQGKNALGGAWGNIATCEISTYEAPGGASGTVSVDANGSTSATVNLPPNALSARWFVQGGTNSTGYPLAATVIATGFIENGNPINLNGVLTISFGQTAWFTVVPFTGTGGTGTALTPIYLRGSYLTYSGSKTVNYSPGGFIERTNPPMGTQDDGNGNCELVGSLAPTDNQIVSMTTTLPSGTTGVTLTQIALDINYGAGLGAPTSAAMNFLRKTSAGGQTLLASAPGSAIGWQSLTGSLSENTAGNGYLVEASRHGGTFGIAVGNTAITYSMSDPKQTL